MRYLDDMLSLCGFDEGQDVPVDAVARRKVYVQAINTMASELGSEHRVAIWDPNATTYNTCRVAFVHLRDVIDWDGLPELSPFTSPEPFSVDEAMIRALEICEEAELDELVKVEVRVDETGLAYTLRALVTELAEDEADE